MARGSGVLDEGAGWMKVLAGLSIRVQLLVAFVVVLLGEAGVAACLAGPTALAAPALGFAMALTVAACAALLAGVAAPLTAAAEALRRAMRPEGGGAMVEGDALAALTAAVPYLREQQAARVAADATVAALRAERAAAPAAPPAADAGFESALAALQTMLAALARGDLTARLESATPAAFADIKRLLNEAVARLGAALGGMGGHAAGLRAGVAEIAQATDDLARRTEQQAASLEETAAALNTITATVKQTAEGAAAARALVTTAKADAERSGSVVRETVQAMAGIETSSKQIGSIIGVIDEIAFQTNLLALNAGVEAARAGDAGRGFAVVATEVRALAQRSADAAKEIKTLISASGQQVASGVKLVGETGAALERIGAQVAQLNGLVSDIAASAQEQATGLAEVNSAVNQMDQVTQQNAAMVEQATAASRNLASEAQALVALAGQFETGRAAPATAPAAPVRKPAADKPRSRIPVHAPTGRFTPVAAPRAAQSEEDWDEF
jgi:methyl-accepting chemotaxis protein